jgi:hypothetical protein
MLFCSAGPLLLPRVMLLHQKILLLTSEKNVDIPEMIEDNPHDTQKQQLL